jgi:polyprenyl P-hydroxybenzoate/phenylacrylic acid decarboxylase-like protein
MQKTIVVGITGASGIIYAIRLLEVLQQYPEIRTHLIISRWAEVTLQYETDYTLEAVCALADQVHDNCNLAASVSSGSFRTDGMIVIPASMKSVAGMACGYADDLLIRAADVTIKERRNLVVVPRETPLSVVHLENLLKLARAGAVILPALPGFYHKPETIGDLIDHTIGKLLDQFAIEHKLFTRWEGTERERLID